jgi:hypothetical protein
MSTNTDRKADRTPNAGTVREALQWFADNPPTDQPEADIDGP